MRSKYLTYYIYTNIHQHSSFVTYFKATLATCEGVINTLVSNPGTRYISKHPSYLLLDNTKHLLMIAHKLSKVLITMRKDQQRLFYCHSTGRCFRLEGLSAKPTGEFNNWTAASTAQASYTQESRPRSNKPTSSSHTMAVKRPLAPNTKHPWNFSWQN